MLNNNDDLLDTNAFHPIATLRERPDGSQSATVKYNYQVPYVQPYSNDGIHPQPDLRIKEDTFTDRRLAKEFGQYLREKGNDPDFHLQSNQDFMDTSMERGYMPMYFEERERRIEKRKTYIIQIDSRYRNHIQSEYYNPIGLVYNNPAQYVIELPVTLHNIKSIRISSSEMPSVNYNDFGYAYLCSNIICGNRENGGNFINFPPLYKDSTQYNRITNIFAKFQLDAFTDGYYTFENHKDATRIYDETPLPELKTIDFTWYNPDGSLYDFRKPPVNNQPAVDEYGNQLYYDHSFALEIVCMTTVIQNTQISSKRGIQDETSE